MNPAHKNFVLLVGCCLALTIAPPQTLGGNASKRQGNIPVLKIEEGYVDAQGVFIYYKSFGSGPPLLIVHGGPGMPFRQPLSGLEPLTGEYRFQYYDQRGCGKSTRPFDRFESQNMYANMTSLDQTLGLGAQTADIERIHVALADTIERVEETTVAIQQFVLRPLKPVGGILAFLKGLQRGLEVFFHAERAAPPVHRRPVLRRRGHGEDDEHLFI